MEKLRQLSVVKLGTLEAVGEAALASAVLTAASVQRRGTSHWQDAGWALSTDGSGPSACTLPLPHVQGGEATASL